MSNTISNAVQTLTDKIVSGSLTPQESAQISVAINQLTTGANVESALVAVAEQHLNTATQSLGQSTTELESAKNTFAQQATTELAKIPELIDSIERSTQKTYNFSVSPVTAIQNLNRLLNNSHMAVYDRRPLHRISLEDFDTGECYFYYDRGDITDSGSSGYAKAFARFGKINTDGTVSVISRRVKLAASQQGYGILPYHDNTSRLFVTNGNPANSTRQTIDIYGHDSWSTDLSFTVDYPLIKVRKSDRALLFVTNGKVTVLGSNGIQSTSTVIESKSEFEQQYNQSNGYFTVTIHTYSHSSQQSQKRTAEQNKVLSLPSKFNFQDHQFEFSKALGLVRSTGIKIDLYGTNWLPHYNQTNAQWSACSEYSGTGLLQASPHVKERPINVTVSYRRGESSASFEVFDCEVLAISRQNNKIVYALSSQNETTEGIAQAI